MRLIDLPTDAGELAKRFESQTRLLVLPLLTVVVIAAAAYFAYQRFLEFEDAQIGRMMEAKAAELRTTAVQEIDARVETLEHFARRWEAIPDPRQDQWVSESEQLMDSRLQFRAVEWRDSMLTVRWFAPAIARMPRMVLDPNGDTQRWGEVSLVADREQGAITRGIQLPDGDRQVLVTAPMWSNHRRVGYLIAAIRMKNLMDAIADPDIARGYSVTISEGALQIFGPALSESDRGTQAADSELQVDELALHIQVWPSPDLETKLRSQGPRITLIAGLMIALVMGTLFYRLETWRARALTAEAKLRAAAATAGSRTSIPSPITPEDESDVARFESESPAPSPASDGESGPDDEGRA
jgi:sensor domain CHASE-containing protein